MRSLLIQASSIEKAVDKAWNSAGMPTEYTIKILDFGEKGFLGITKRNAIVSIIYDPQKQTSMSDSQKKRSEQRTHAEPRRQPQKPSRPQQKRPMQRQKPQRREVSQRKEISKNPPVRKTPIQKQPAQKPAEERLFWTDTMINDVNTWLKHIIKTIGMSTPFHSQVNKKALTLTFQSNVMDKREDERLLFSSLSYVLIQLIKKTHKKKYQGYQILITSKRNDTSRGMTPPAGNANKEQKKK